MASNIVLVGFMGCGKSTVGRRLAAMLRWEFDDTDARIEEEQKMQVSEIFLRKGERAFRKMERDLSPQAVRKDPSSDCHRGRHRQGSRELSTP